MPISLAWYFIYIHFLPEETLEETISSRNYGNKTTLQKKLQMYLFTELLNIQQYL